MKRHSYQIGQTSPDLCIRQELYGFSNRSSMWRVGLKIETSEKLARPGESWPVEVSTREDSGQLSSMRLRARRKVVFWSDRPAGVQTCPAPPRPAPTPCAAPPRPARHVRLLDSTICSCRSSSATKITSHEYLFPDMPCMIIFYKDK